MTAPLNVGTGPQRLLHGALVCRLQRQLAKAARLGGEERLDKVLATTQELIELEDRMHNPLGPWEPVTVENMQARLALMTRGAGLEVVSRHGRSNLGRKATINQEGIR